MYDSPEAAQLVTVTGWVSRLGHFYGENEHLARFDGCTHRKCEECGKAISIRSFTSCSDCRDRASEVRFLALPSEPYEEQVCCNLDGDQFFFSQDDIVDYAEEHEIPHANLRLVKCEPQYAEEVDPREVYEDLLPEGGDLPGYVVEAFGALNEALRVKAHPICWMPVDVRVVLPEDFPVYVSATTEARNVGA
jgi:hypothetical protein